MVFITMQKKKKKGREKEKRRRNMLFIKEGTENLLWWCHLLFMWCLDTGQAVSLHWSFYLYIYIILNVLLRECMRMSSTCTVAHGSGPLTLINN